MKTLSPRARLLLIIGGGIVLLIIVAGSLSQLSFALGSPLPFKEITPPLIDDSVPDDFTRIMMAIIRVMFMLMWLLLPLAVILFFVSKEMRRRVITQVVLVVLLILALYFVNRGIKQEETPAQFPMMPQSMPELGLTQTPAPPVQEYIPPEPWVTTLTTILLAGGITLIVVVIAVVIWRRSRQAQNEPLARVRREAQAALDAIQAGGDLRDVILRCYSQMVQAAAEYRNIRRTSDMTPHEFEQILANRGVPGSPVHDLTLLFEQVRYGAYRPSRQDERTAVASLSAIISACERMKSE